MGNTPSKVLYQWLFGSMMLIWSHIYSVFSTAPTIQDSFPNETSELENPDTTVSCEPQEQHSSSISEGPGPVLEVTPDSSLAEHLELSSIRSSQTTREDRLLNKALDIIFDRYPEPDDHELWPPDEISLPEVTISGSTETGQAYSSIIVPKQRAYTGRMPVISSRLADTPCVTLGIQGLLNQLNTTLGTSHTLDTPSLLSLLAECIANNYDFGMAYSLLRRIWYTHDWSTIQAKLWRWEEEDWEMRRKALVGNQIVDPFLPPRRVWDLYSNRVVPRWIMLIDNNSMWQWPDPISHAWVDEKDRVDVWTPINGYEWPVPVPKESDLNLIRIEMLNLGLEYAWLDVLCLRQVGGPGEDMRTEEWKLDVPVIGAMYRQTEVVCYLSGLGRPLSLKEGDLDSDQCWFRRAWTLQEVGDKMVIAGDTPDGPMHAKRKGRKYETKLLTRFHKQLESTVDITQHVAFVALGEMQNRVSTNPVDKVAGLAFLLWPETIPAYHEGQSLEEAWTALVNSMLTLGRGELFSLFPEPGNARAKWRPSWDQVMSKPLPAYDHNPHTFVDRDETGDEDSCNVYTIEKGLVQGLAVVEGGHRHGELIVKDKGGIERGFKITANHTYPIPEDTYTLIDPGTEDLWMSCYRWVVGRSLPGGIFEKVSLVEIPRKKERKRLKKLRTTEKRRYILI